MNTRTLFTRLALVSVLALSVTALRAEEKGKADVPPGVLKKYDKNQDGALDAAEKAKWEADKAANREKAQAKRAEMLEKYDANKDGKLSEEEHAAAKLEREKAKSERMAEKMKERAEKPKGEKGKEASAAKGGNASEKAKGKEKGQEAKDGAAPAEEGAMMQ